MVPATGELRELNVSDEAYLAAKHESQIQDYAAAQGVSRREARKVLERNDLGQRLEDGSVVVGPDVASLVEDGRRLRAAREQRRIRQRAARAARRRSR